MFEAVAFHAGFLGCAWVFTAAMLEAVRAHLRLDVYEERRCSVSRYPSAGAGANGRALGASRPSGSLETRTTMTTQQAADMLGIS